MEWLANKALLNASQFRQDRDTGGDLIIKTNKRGPVNKANKRERWPTGCCNVGCWDKALDQRDSLKLLWGFVNDQL